MKQNATRLLSTLLTLCMVLAMLPGTALAAEVAYAVEGGNLYFDTATGTITRCDESVTKADIPAAINGVAVTGIGSFAEEYEEYLHKGAFQDCKSLTSITIPAGVTSIGEATFMNCYSLTGITIPAGVTRIGGAAFCNCSSLTNITIPTGVTRIEVYTFANCSSLTSITIPASIARIEYGAIDYAAFQDCKSLTDVYYGGSQSNWEEISINQTDAANAALFAATIHYNSASPAPAAPNAPQQTPATPAAAANSVSVTVNGNAVQWPDAIPFIDANNRTMVPLRAVADAIGLDVSWDGNTREASFANGGKTLTFPIGSNTARGSDGTTITMNTAAVVVSGRTYAPVRYLAEFFGYQVDWDANSRTVIIKG